jgi:hypothetical protein
LEILSGHDQPIVLLRNFFLLLAFYVFV